MTAIIRSHSPRVITVLQSLVAVADFAVPAAVFVAAAAGLAAVPLQTPFRVITGAFSGTFAASGAGGVAAAGPVAVGAPAAGAPGLDADGGAAGALSPGWP